MAITGAKDHIDLYSWTYEQEQAKLWKIVKIFMQGEKIFGGHGFSLVLTCKTPWRSRRQLDFDYSDYIDQIQQFPFTPKQKRVPLITWCGKKKNDRVGSREIIMWVTIIIQKLGYSFDA